MAYFPSRYAPEDYPFIERIPREPQPDYPEQDRLRNYEDNPAEIWFSHRERGRWEGRSGWLYRRSTRVLRYAEDMIKIDPKLIERKEHTGVYMSDLVYDNEITITKTVTDFRDYTYAYHIKFSLQETPEDTPIRCEIVYEELHDLFKLSLYCKDAECSRFAGEFNGHSFRSGRSMKPVPANSDSDSDDQIVCEGRQSHRW